MKIKNLILALVLLTLTVPAFAQTTTTQTILSAALGGAATNTTLTVASATGISASSNATAPNLTGGQTFLYIDREQMQVRAVSGTTITVIRGVGSTPVTSHNLNAIVFYGMSGSFLSRAGTGSVVSAGPFLTVTPVGPCTATAQAFLPVVNIRTGDLSNCIATFSTTPGTIGTSGKWQTTNFNQYISGLGVTNVADAAYTALLTDNLVNYVRLNATRVLTLPSITGIEGKILIIKRPQDDSTAAITITPVNNQWIGTAGTTTLSLTGQGNVVRLFSFLATQVSTNTWVWGTF